MLKKKKSTNFQSHHHPIAIQPRLRSFKYFMEYQADPSSPRGCSDDSESPFSLKRNACISSHARISSSRMISTLVWVCPGTGSFILLWKTLLGRALNPQRAEDPSFCPMNESCPQGSGIPGDLLKW